MQYKSFPKLAFFLLALISPSVFAWDGAVTAKIAAVHVAPGSNYGFRVEMEGSPQMCAGGASWAYLNDTDSNYKTFVAVLLIAKTQGTAVSIFSNLDAGQCHIGYLFTAK